MNLQEFNSPLPKPWLNINANSINADIITAGSFVGPVLADSITLNQQLSVPNPAVGQSTIYVDLNGKITTQDTVNSTTAYVPVTGAQMLGNLDMNANSLQNVLLLSGATNSRTGDDIVSNAGAAVIDNLASFSNVNGKEIKDSGVLSTNIVSNIGAAVVNNLASFSNVSGKEIQDSGVLASNLFLADGTVPMTGNLNMNGHQLNNVLNITTSNNSVIVGNGAASSGGSQVAVGQNANSGAGAFSIAIGVNSSAVGARGLAVGSGAITTGVDSVSVGRSAQGSGSNQTIIGSNSTCNASQYACTFGQACHSDAFAAITIASGNNNTTNSVAQSVLFGDALISNVRPDNNGLCDLGSSSNNFKACYLIDSQVAVGSKFSMYDDVAVDNTVVETSINTGLAVGNLAYSPTIPLGTVFEFDVNFLVNSAAGDTLTLRYYSNAGLLFSHVLVYAALTVNSAGNIHTMITVRNGAVQVNSIEMINGAVNMVTASAVVFDRTIANTFNVSAQWGANASQFTCNQFFLKTNYRS